ncbi:MAG TPA: hypothetical protein VM935_06000 [Chitinophagaceae bacterium]|jgi:nitrous oxide reductase accessory protein NosL|nr:hypothetical protein [Chitinophagaceae bacterium]
MEKKFPLHFTLGNGTKVAVTEKGSNTYEFTLHPEEGANRQFTYVNDEAFTSKAEETFDFEQLDALRKFWLELEDIG